MDMPLLEPGERLDEVNFSIRLIQKTSGLTYGTDALLLSAFIHGSERDRAVELGGGSGIISLLALSRGKCGSVDCVEIQPAYAALIARNAALNGLTDRLRAHCADVRDYAAPATVCGTADLVFANPPYMTQSGAPNRAEEKHAARHELHGDIFDFCSAAARLLRFGGRFFCVFRPDRMAELLAAMQACRLAPKRLTMVHADAQSVPSMLLLEAIAGGKQGMRVTPPLLLYRDSDTYPRPYTEAMNYVMREGCLPSAFRP